MFSKGMLVKVGIVLATLYLFFSVIGGVIGGMIAYAIHG